MNSEDVRALIDELNETINWLKRTGSLHDAGRVQRAVAALEESSVSTPEIVSEYGVGWRVLHEFHGDGVWRDDEGNVWMRQSEAVEAVRSAESTPEPVWEYGLYDPATNEVDECGPEPVTRESFTGIDWEATGEEIVRRRPAGPWEPVPTEGEA